MAQRINGLTPAEWEQRQQAALAVWQATRSMAQACAALCPDRAPQLPPRPIRTEADLQVLLDELIAKYGGR